MNISLRNIGKRYNFEWIFRKVDHELTAGNHCAILGSNGSGKSTLLQLIAGYNTSSEGEIFYSDRAANPIHQDDLYSCISIAAPYLELYEDFTLEEAVRFHEKFKSFRGKLSTQALIESTGLKHAAGKQLKYFSSGMKQRVRLALAVMSDTSLLLLDEPASNLDRQGIDWYQNLVADHSSDRLIIVASNQQEFEYPFCTSKLQVEDFKQS